MTPEQLAQIAYEAYCNAGTTLSSRGRFSATGWRQFKWDRLEPYQKNAWIAAAQAVKANVLSGFTKVGEGEQA